MVYYLRRGMADDKQNDDLDVPPPGDPDEFAKVGAPKPRRHPIGAAVVIGLGALLLWHTRADLKYALSSRTPVDLGDARSLEARAVNLADLDNRYVRATGLPDRRNALAIEPRGEKSRHLFARLLGTKNRLFVRVVDTSTRSELADAWAGRLRRIDALPWAGQLRDYYATKVTARRFMTADALKDALARPATADVDVVDRAGQPLKVAASVSLALDLVRPDQLRVLLARDQFAAEEDAKKEIERLGLSATPDYGTRDAFAFVVDAPPAMRNDVIGKIESRSFAFQAADLSVAAARADLSVDGTTLVIAKGEVVVSDGQKIALRNPPLRIPLSQLTAASVEEPILIPADAYVLVEGEAPGGLVWVPIVAAFILAFIAFNLFYLVRGRRA
jgi:hypothetical protein